jgi:hypothetical protein
MTTQPVASIFGSIPYLPFGCILTVMSVLVYPVRPPNAYRVNPVKAAARMPDKALIGRLRQQ